MSKCHEKKFKKDCHKDHFDCNCHKKKKDCCPVQLVKDCVCVEWSVPEGQTQTVFQTAGFKPIFASGFISFDCGSADFIRVRFFDGNKVVGEVVRVFEDSSFAFTYTKFDRITVECPNMIAGITSTPKPDRNHECEGELCINVRFPVKK